MKKFFSSQKITKELEDGSLIIDYNFTCYQEVEEFLLQWLPNVDIIGPSSLKDYMKTVLTKKLEALQ